MQEHIFLQAMLRTGVNEMGYANDPNDPGGETNYGITVDTARANGYSGDMKNLPFDFAISIYYDRYWKKPLFCEILDDLHCDTAKVLFDFGVNCGTGAATKCFQELLNFLNRDQTSWKDIAVDGVIGWNETIPLWTDKIVGNQKDLEAFPKYLLIRQGEYYNDLVRREPWRERYYRGWMSRLDLKIF